MGPQNELSTPQLLTPRFSFADTNTLGVLYLKLRLRVKRRKQRFRPNNSSPLPGNSSLMANIYRNGFVVAKQLSETNGILY
ncbi:hypothetical protein J6590_016182 [Homalodisca vitripennis]|nr:hypothetical protein J6590_016182 [Homalodisca vitripennis]